MPQIVSEAARGLSEANVNVLNGADGLSEFASGLVSQGISIMNAVRSGTGAPVQANSDDRTSTDLTHSRDDNDD